jgi:hypothetical protein
VSGLGIDCGSGASICDVRVPPGSTLSLSASAGTDARFDGWGGACSGASTTCSVTVQGDVSVTAAFELELQTLFADDGTSTPQSLAINSTDVFFLRVIGSHTSTWAIPKSGGSPRLVMETAGNAMIADDGFVYFSNPVGIRGQAIFSVPVGGGTPSMIFFFNDSLQGIGALALDQGALYFAVGGSIHRMQDRVDQVIANAVGAFSSSLAVDSGFVYFTFASNGFRGIARVDKHGGGTASRLVVPSAEPITVRVDSQNLYWRDADGTVFAAGKDGSASRKVSGNPGTSFLRDFDVNASVVWWIWAGDPNLVPQGLFRANPDGSGFGGVDTASDTDWAAGPRVDDTAAYYFHNRSLMKHLK